MSQDTVFITGATGFLGGVLTRAVRARGQSVIASGRDRQKLSALTAPGITTLALDLSQPVTPPLTPCRYMVHCAALSSPWGRKSTFKRANIDGTRGAIDLARKMGVQRFVHISTPSLYFRFADQQQIREDAPLPPPINAYADTKRRAEDLIRAAKDLDPIILRPRGIYGRGDTALLPRLLNTAKRRPLPMLRGGRAATDLTHVDDVVAAILAALDQPSAAGCPTYNISGGTALTIRHVVDTACARAGIQPRWRRLPTQLVKTVAHLSEAASRLHPKHPEPAITVYAAGLFAFRQTLDISKAASGLGWRPQIGFEEGLDRTFSDGSRA